MIGLTVLGALLVYLTIAILVTIRVARWIKSRKVRWTAVLVCIAIFVLIPTWDEILGRMYFNCLCEDEGGVRIYKTVELGPEYWKGGNILPDSEIGLIESQLGRRFRIKTKDIEGYKGLARIRLIEDILQDIETQDILAIHTAFIYFGGWVVNSTGAHVTGQYCHGYRAGDFRSFLAEVFEIAHRHDNGR